MVVVIACATAVALGIVAVWRWGAIEAERPDGDAAARYLWHLDVGVCAGLMAGLLVGGPGGRLVMRLLAATAGDGAQGRLTEADEVVGQITVNGTLGFIVFVGLAGGLVTGIAYTLIRRWLPARRLGGAVFGVLLLVLVAPLVDPLRRENPDFDLVGPGWLAIVAFGALMILHGMVVAACSARYRSTLPLLSGQPRVLVRYLPLALPMIFVPLAVLVVAGGVVFWAVDRAPAVLERLRSRAVLVGGRVVLGATAIVGLPTFLAAMSDIAGRGP